MDTVTGGPFGPRSERPIQVFRCSVGRKDPTPPRHEARRPRLPEVGPKTTCGVTGLSTFTSSRIHPSFDATRARRLLVDISLSIPVGPIYCHDHQTSLLEWAPPSNGPLRLEVSRTILRPVEHLHSFHPSPSPTITISPLSICDSLNEYYPRHYNRPLPQSAYRSTILP